MRVDMDFGYAEIFQYIQFNLAALLLILLFIKQRKVIYIVWALFFFVLFLDDAFRFHESIGAKFSNYFGIEAAIGLKAKDFGELAIAALLGSVFVIPFTSALFFGKRKAREVTIHLGILVVLLLTFGIGIDMLHSFLRDKPWAGALTLIEDAGEMFSASLMVCYVTCLHIKGKEMSNSRLNFSGSAKDFITNIEKDFNTIK